MSSGAASSPSQTALNRDLFNDNIESAPGYELCVCNICTDIADVPVTCPRCQNNVFCRSCIASWLIDGARKNATVGSCPSCKEPWNIRSPSDLVPNRLVMGLIEKLPAHCLNEGCPLNVQQQNGGSTYNQIVLHMFNCEYQLVECSYAGRGCTQKVSKKFQAEHEENCEYRTEVCDQCGQELSRITMQEHKEVSCPRAEVSCPLICGHTCIRRDLEFHICHQCPKRRVACEHASHGCNWHGLYEDMLDKHLLECPYELAGEALRTLEAKVNSLTEELAAERAKVAQLTLQARNDKETIERLNAELQKFYMQQQQQQQSQQQQQAPPPPPPYAQYHHHHQQQQHYHPYQQQSPPQQQRQPPPQSTSPPPQQQQQQQQQQRARSSTSSKQGKPECAQQ